MSSSPAPLSPIITPEFVSMAFATRVANSPVGQFVDSLVLRNTDAVGDSVKYPFGHNPPAPHRTDKRAGGKGQARDAGAESVRVYNYEWENSVRVAVRDARRNPEFASRQFGALGQRWAAHSMRILTSEILIGNPTGYDGVSFFSTAHKLGTGDTQNNDLVAGVQTSLNVSDPTAPTPEELVLAIVDGIARLESMEDETGEPINEGSRRYACMFHSSMSGRFQTAIRTNMLAQGQSNVIAGRAADGDLSVVPIPNVRLSNAAQFILFNIDEAFPMRAIVLQEEAPLDLAILDEASEYAKDTGFTKAIGRWSGGVGPGEHLMAARFTLS